MNTTRELPKVIVLLQGYHGVLCGACKKNYTKGASDNVCHRCRSKAVEVSIVVIAIAWFSVLAAIVLYTAMSFLEPDTTEHAASSGSHLEDVTNTRQITDKRSERAGQPHPCDGCNYDQPVQEGRCATVSPQGNADVELTKNKTSDASGNEIDNSSATNMVRGFMLMHVVFMLQMLISAIGTQDMMLHVQQPYMPIVLMQEPGLQFL